MGSISPTSLLIELLHFKNILCDGPPGPKFEFLEGTDSVLFMFISSASDMEEVFYLC